MPFLIFLVWLCCLLPGCEGAPESGPKAIFTYTLDAQTREILEQLDVQGTNTWRGRNLAGHLSDFLCPKNFCPMSRLC